MGIFSAAATPTGARDRAAADLSPPPDPPESDLFIFIRGFCCRRPFNFRCFMALSPDDCPLNLKWPP
jgi:hypothetical protein